MHMSILYAWSIMAQNNNIAVQVVAHLIDITCDECSVACTPAIQPCNSLAITHCIIYPIVSNHAIMTHMTSAPIIFLWPHTFMTNTTNPSGQVMTHFNLHTLSPLSYPCPSSPSHPHTHVPHIPPLPCCLPHLIS